MSNSTRKFDIILDSSSIVQNWTFSWFDYSLFSFMVTLTMMVGIYFGCFGTKQTSTQEYILGDKKMKTLPISISLIAGHISSITILGTPSDVYRYGGGLLIGSLAYSIAFVLIIYIYLPVFYKLNITSIYEYLEIRFNRRTRIFGSMLFAMYTFLYTPIVIYGPALAFSSASGLNVYVVSIVMCSICVFYTSIGGLQSVVWTDVLQFILTSIAILTVFCCGLNTAGGIGNIIETAQRGQRLDIFDTDFDPTKRDTIWMTTVGMAFFVTGTASVDQTCVQKFLSLPTLRDAKWTVFWYCLGSMIIKALSAFTGIIMYSLYYNCDPLTSNQIRRPDELVPYYVLDVTGSLPGISGLFIAGVFAAALSTLSSYISCLAATLYEDCVKLFLPKLISKKKSSKILKIIIVIIGIVNIATIFLIEKLMGIRELQISLAGATAGPIFGMFTLGILFRTCNAKGAFYGGLIGVIFMSILVFGRKYYETIGILGYPTKPLSTAGCNLAYDPTDLPVCSNSTYHESYDTSSNVWIIFKISYYYYTLIGTVITMSTGLVISFITTKCI